MLCCEGRCAEVKCGEITFRVRLKVTVRRGYMELNHTYNVV